MPDITLTELFTGVIAVISTIVFFRGVPTKKDMESIKKDINMIVNRMDRHLEYHTRTKMLIKNVVLFFAMCAAASASSDLEYNQGYALSVAVERCDLVFVGRVKIIDYVYRRSIKTGYTTDITVEVEKLIKGTPNIGKQTVKFMIEGGEGIHPDTGEDLRLEVSNAVKYETGDRRLFFLARSNDPYHANWLYGKLIEYRGGLGAQKVNNDKISVLYLSNASDSRSLKVVIMPLDVVLDLTIASLKDKAGVVLLENQIKAELASSDGFVVVLSDTLKSTLKTGAKRITE